MFEGCNRTYEPDSLPLCGGVQREIDAWGRASPSVALAPTERWLAIAGRTLGPDASVILGRWLDDRSVFRREEAEMPADRYVVSIALRRTRLRLTQGSNEVFDGTMSAGMAHVAAPSQRLSAEFHSPCEFLHVCASDAYLRRRRDSGLSGDSELVELRGGMIRDPLLEQLARTLIEGSRTGLRRCPESVPQSIVLRLLSIERLAPCGSAMPKWRLKRVQDHVASHLSARLRLPDLARVAGLSRMHFAAQFRTATGFSPHEYVLAKRIECAKAVLSEERTPLAEIALHVGFETQSHFTSVFKRWTGSTPGRWRRANMK
jgi:AraC family transcriptional regulator